VATLTTTRRSARLVSCRGAVCLLACLLAVTLLAACKETPEPIGIGLQPVRVPEWTTTGVHPDYPEDRYIVTYGVARLGRDAVQQAVDRLEAEICGWPLYEHRSLIQNTNLAEMLTLTPAWLPLERLGDAVRSEHASSGFENYALRAISFDELRLRARALLPQVQRELTEADQPVGGMGNLNDRISLWGEYFLLAGQVVMLQLIAEGTLNRLAFMELEEAALQLWELPSLMRVHQGGDRGRCNIQGGVDEPLLMVARFRNRVPSGVPIVWEPAVGFRGALAGDEAFNTSGQAEGRVLRLTPTGDEFGYVQARIDLDRAIGRRTGIALQPWLWTVVLPARTNSEVLVDIQESINGEADDDPVLSPKLAEWCKGRGFMVRELGAGFSDRPYKLRIRGHLEVRSWVTNELPFAHASGRIELVDEDTGQVLFRYYPGIQKEGQRGNTERAMILSAQQDAVADVVAEMGARLLTLVPGEDDEFGRGR
jgi:hypothetical protein